ncbi:YqaJ viral recombinase family protein [Caballeronia sp. LZ035]|uniref:lambda exonuclease family protein n=1 Tax=Caballeronia sp. LZ035 TaxID=3038568 RepID=UPI0028604811|nr:YqaJ viral recombinase family protein [Caballeronia sp. LZ035]MDR5756989.1 YqaJ viral recombinase family protein [Caballeronia sp. LZ035]
MSDVIEQRTDEWRAQRAGRLTASRFGDVISLTKAGKPTAARDKYMREIVFERLASTAKHSVDGHALRWGTEVESFAKEAFELETGMIVMQAEFQQHSDYAFIGASPDGLINGDGGYESKCPMDEAVHINTLLHGMPEEHIPQVQGCMMVTGRKYWMFVSYDPRVSERFRLYHERVERDDDYINGVLLPCLLQFNAEVEQMIAELNRRVA